MKQQYLYLGILVLLFTACQNKPSSQAKTSETTPTKLGSWKAIGTEPFWNLQIKEDTILLTTLGNQIDSTYYELVSHRDEGNLQLFILQNPNNQEQLNITFIKENSTCSDGMSDNEFEYHAQVGDLKGCASKLE